MLNITEYMYIIDNGSLLIKNIILDTSVCNKYNRLTYKIIHYYTFKSLYLSSYRPYRRYRIDIDSTSILFLVHQQRFKQWYEQLCVIIISISISSLCIRYRRYGHQVQGWSINVRNRMNIIDVNNYSQVMDSGMSYMYQGIKINVRNGE